MLSSRRRAFTVWELAARGGEPVVAVNWWATFPAESLPGLVVAHGAYQLLSEVSEGSAGADDAVAPQERSEELRALRAQVDAGPSGEAVLAALPSAEAAAILNHALLPDRFYRAAFVLGLSASPRAAALYLPGLDIAADQWRGSDVALADLVRRQLVETDQLLAENDGRFATVAVVFDPGRRGGGEGRILLWREPGCTAVAASGRPGISPAALTAGLLRALGLPQSADLPEPPALCAWPEPPARITTFGERHPAAAASVQGEEYLQSLQALGYL